MFFDQGQSNSAAYQALPDDEGKGNFQEPKDIDEASGRKWQNRRRHLGEATVILLAIAVGFAAGALSMLRNIRPCYSSSVPGAAPRIPIPTIQGEFVYHSPFEKEPPRGSKAGNVSEPIWDELVPKGLGYFKDGNLAPQVSIPTAIHQLHCLYVVRRAYYSQSEELQEFAFGKDRTAHASHCFDYLAQSITCAVDTTIEPAIDDPNVFLGSGFPRQCRDFNALKDFLEANRVFNATGFLAVGLDHGHAHIDSEST